MSCHLLEVAAEVVLVAALVHAALDAVVVAEPHIEVEFEVSHLVGLQAVES